MAMAVAVVGAAAVGAAMGRLILTELFTKMF